MPRTWDSYSALGGRASNGCGSCTVAEAAQLQKLHLDASDRREFAFRNRR